MTLAITTVDQAALPTALLPLAKSHIRIDHTADDAYITNAIMRAIARLEDRTGVTFNPCTVTWVPAADAFSDGAATIPVRPVNSFTAVAGTPAVNVSSSFATYLKYEDLTGAPIQVMRGAYATGLIFTLQCGYTDLTKAPSALDRVLANTAHLWEYREILAPGVPYLMPDQDMDATWWIPRL